MKRILIALAVLASVQFANAQVKPEAAKKAVESAVEASQNAKKATKAATWINLGKAYVSAYDAPAGSIWVGAAKTELGLLMGNEKPQSSEVVTLGGVEYTKDIYADKALYFDANGILQVIEVTKPIVENALEEAAVAYKKAYALDSKKLKEVTEAIDAIAAKYVQEAYNYYTLGDLAGASQYFQKAADVVADEPLNKIDTLSIYNTGFTAQMAGDNARAKEALERCVGYGYYSDGEVFSKLAVVDAANAKKYLEEGFSKFPENQSILIGLINYYLDNNEDTNTLFSLLDQAKKNEPNNASLYYVEGNIRRQLGQLDEALVAYNKCAEINPEYEFGYIGAGVMFYENAIEVQTKAQEELDDAKYMALVADFEKSLKNSIEPFEKAYQISKDNDTKVGIAEYLKNAFYRFISESAEYQDAYNKYAKVVETGQAE